MPHDRPSGPAATKPRPRRIPRYRWQMMVALFVVVTLGFLLGIVLPSG